MFTGIIEHLGMIQSIERQDEKARLVVSTGPDFTGFELGESIAVNGACLTVVEFDEFSFSLDLSTETLKRTSFDKIDVKEKVNLERSLTLNKKMSGHFVLGHVDGVGHVESIDEQPGEVLMRFSHPPELAAHFIEKGSATVEGISLTVFDCRENGFTVSIIPFTWKHTNLHAKKTGDVVNLECDMIGKYVLKACEHLIPKGNG